MPPKLKYKQQLKPEWFSIIDENGDTVSEYLKKVSNDSFSARCIWCKAEFNVAHAGAAAIKLHASRLKHKQVANDMKKRNLGQQYFQLPNQSEAEEV